MLAKVLTFEQWDTAIDAGEIEDLSDRLEDGFLLTGQVMRALIRYKGKTWRAIGWKSPGMAHGELTEVEDTMDETLQVTTSDMAKVFAEWDRRYRANPEGFMSQVEHLLHNTPESYGDDCAVYFTHLLKEVCNTPD